MYTDRQTAQEGYRRKHPGVGAWVRGCSEPAEVLTKQVYAPGAMMTESIVGDGDDAGPTGAAADCTRLERIFALDVEGMMW